MQNIDYAKIMFSKSDIKLLQSLDEKHPKHLQHDKFVSFSQFDFVTPHVVGQDKYGAEISDETYYITDAGKTYLQYLKSKRREKYPQKCAVGLQPSLPCLHSFSL